jgi:hypothetical protein
VSHAEEFYVIRRSALADFFLAAQLAPLPMASTDLNNNGPPFAGAFWDAAETPRVADSVIRETLWIELQGQRVRPRT